jgi:SAM-dependent methyltransferase
MTSVESASLGYNETTPRTSHDGLAAEMYGRDFFAPADGSILNVAAGYTDLSRDLHGMGIDKSVISLDPVYATHSRFQQRPNYVAGTADTVPYPDDSFAVTLCQYGMQHIADKGAALQEMVRVTRPAESIRDTAKGTILLGPVFKPTQLAAAIYGANKGLELVCGIQNPPEQVRSKFARPTLVIKKTADLDEGRVAALISAIEHTGALDTRRTLGEMASRLLGGHSKY